MHRYIFNSKSASELTTECYAYSTEGTKNPDKAWLHTLSESMCTHLGFPSCTKEHFGFFSLERQECLQQFVKFMYLDNNAKNEISELFEELESQLNPEEVKVKYFTTFKYSGNGGSGYNVVQDHSSSYVVFLISEKTCYSVLVRWED